MEKTSTGSAANNSDPAVVSVQNSVSQVEEIQKALKKEDPDWALVLGIGSLVRSANTDYVNESNVIHATGLGHATPQLLTGVSFRSNLPNLYPKYRVAKAEMKDAQREACKGNNPDPSVKCPLDEWQRRPWNAFVSLKFSPGSSQTISGYVIGVSYSLAHYLNALCGFALTPVNQPSPGFRVTASQFVTSQQKQGLYQNFDATKMLNNANNAFDGFPIADPSGKLIYTGNPTTVRYTGGIIVGVSIPVYFGTVFK